MTGNPINETRKKREEEWKTVDTLDAFNRKRDANLRRLVKLGYGETPGGVVDYLLIRAFDDLYRSGVLK